MARDRRRQALENTHPSGVATLCDIPSDAVPVTVVEVCEYLTSDGRRRFDIRLGGDPSMASAVGMLRVAEQQILTESATWPLR